MCVTVVVKTDDNTFRCVENKSDLAEILGIKPIRKEAYLHVEDFNCLCAYDIEKTAVAAGYTATVGWHTSGCDWLIEPCLGL